VATRTAPRRRAAVSGRARRALPARGGAAERRIALSAEERAVLVRACVRYRTGLPTYLASVRSEFRVLARVLRKLSAREL
jgi:hypothetical protein